MNSIQVSSSPSFVASRLPNFEAPKTDQPSLLFLLQVHVNTEIATAEFPPARGQAVAAANTAEHELLEDANRRDSRNNLAPVYADGRSPFNRTNSGGSDRLAGLVPSLNHSESDEGFDFDDDSTKGKSNGSRTNLQ